MIGYVKGHLNKYVKCWYWLNLGLPDLDPDQQDNIEG